MLDLDIALTILSMAAVTYITRILGYLVLSRCNLSTRAMNVMETAPGCVLITIIAPKFVSTNLADLIALAITIFAASRLSLLSTVLIGIMATGCLRYILT